MRAGLAVLLLETRARRERPGFVIAVAQLSCNNQLMRALIHLWSDYL